MFLSVLSVLLQILLPLASAIPIPINIRDLTVTEIVDGNPLVCTAGSIGIDPSIPQGYVNQFCSTVSASQPDWLIKVTGLPQGNVDLLYAWEAAGNDYSQTCSTKCVQAFTDIIQTCKYLPGVPVLSVILTTGRGEYDSHDIDGEGTYTEACGQFVLQINPEV
jgi:hypothetical protein